MGMQEPRFLLDKDSVCYGCEFYRHISECDPMMHLGDVDGNGGVCDTEKMCVAGSRNPYEVEDVREDDADGKEETQGYDLG